MRFSVCVFASLFSLSLSVMFTGSASAGALPTEFAKLDKNGDYQVSFAEYKLYADSAGVSPTEAAQDFVRAAQGDAVLTEDELKLALLMEGKAYALKPGTLPNSVIPLGPQPLSDVQDVEEEPIYGYEAIPAE